jgi:hypothetical protein
MPTITLYLGLDVHKDPSPSPLPNPALKRAAPLRLIINSIQAIERVLSRIRKLIRAHLEVAYEAGPCGFGIARHSNNSKSPRGRSPP